MARCCVPWAGSPVGAAAALVKRAVLGRCRGSYALTAARAARRDRLDLGRGIGCVPATRAVSLTLLAFPFRNEGLMPLQGGARCNRQDGLRQWQYRERLQEFCNIAAPALPLAVRAPSPQLSPPRQESRRASDITGAMIGAGGGGVARWRPASSHRAAWNCNEDARLSPSDVSSGQGPREPAAVAAAQRRRVPCAHSRYGVLPSSPSSAPWRRS